MDINRSPQQLHPEFQGSYLPAVVWPLSAFSSSHGRSRVQIYVPRDPQPRWRIPNELLSPEYRQMEKLPPCGGLANTTAGFYHSFNICGLGKTCGHLPPPQLIAIFVSNIRKKSIVFTRIRAISCRHHVLVYQ